jgi:hypothetical protein
LDFSSLLPSWAGLRDNLWTALIMSTPFLVSWIIARLRNSRLQWVAFLAMEIFLGFAGQAAEARFGVVAVAPAIIIILLPFFLLLFFDRHAKKGAPLSLGPPAAKSQAVEDAAQRDARADWEMRRTSAIHAIVADYNLAMHYPNNAAKYLAAAGSASAILWQTYTTEQEKEPGSQFHNAYTSILNAATVSAERLHLAMLDIARLANLTNLVLEPPSGQPAPADAHAKEEEELEQQRQRAAERPEIEEVQRAQEQAAEFARVHEQSKLALSSGHLDNRTAQVLYARPVLGLLPIVADNTAFLVVQNTGYPAYVECKIAAIYGVDKWPGGTVYAKWEDPAYMMLEDPGSPIRFD